MEIFGLVGPSGSGKSHCAEQAAHKLNAPMIIDDGLLISHGKILAGFSAKFEGNPIAAVRRAVFLDSKQRSSVVQQLRLHPSTALLILGTSEKMVRTICMNLNIEGHINWVPIESIASTEQISLAHNLRKYGLHAIPIRESQIEESSYYKRLLQKITFKFFHKDAFIPVMPTKGLTIVNPPFTGGAIYIHPRVIKQSVEHLAALYDYPFHVKRVSTAVEVLPCIHVVVHADWCENLMKPAREFIHHVEDYLETTLGFPITQVQLRIDSISPPGEGVQTKP